MADQRPDGFLRAMTDDKGFRIITIRSTELVTGVLKAQQVEGELAKHLGDLVTGATLLRETMSPSLRVQALLKRNHVSGYLLGDSHPNGQSRGLAAQKPGAGFQMTDAVMQVVRSLQDGSIQQGVVSVPDGSSVSQGLMAYMQESEQITTMIVVATLLKEHTVTAAGGYVVQLLPGAPYGTLAIMTERLADFENIDRFLSDPDFSPRSLCDELLYGMPYTVVGEGNLGYGCWCSRASVLSALASISRADIQNMVDDGQVLEINCDYCGEDYRVTPPELTGLLSSN